MLGIITIAGGELGKGRVFEGLMLACFTCSEVTFYDGELRPSWAVLATDQGSAKPFLANLRLGRAAQYDGKSMKFLPKLGYRFDQQVCPEGGLFCVYLPRLFAFDAHVDEDSLRFAVLVERQRVEAFQWERDKAKAWLKRLRRELPDTVLDLVPFFAAYLDRRCKLPLPASLEFQAQLLAGLLREGAVATPSRVRSGSVWCDADGMESVGVHPPIFMAASHERFREYCIDEVALYVSNGGQL